MSRPNFEKLGPPPRHVPFSLRLPLLLGGVLGAIGWFLVIFLTPFLWIMLAEADVIAPLVLGPSSPSVMGRVIGTKETGASEGKVRIYGVQYDYRVPSGPHLTGWSYTKGSLPEIGSEVKVQYLESYPNLSRIEGMRRGMFGPGALMILIFVFVAAGLLGAGVYMGRGTLRLLRDGELTTARFVSQKPTNMTVNNRVVQELTFEYTTRLGQKQTFTHNTTDPSTVTDERQESVLVLPDKPDDGHPVDGLPKNVQADESGNLVSGSALGVIGWLILPMLAALSHGGCAYYRFFR